MQDIPKDIITKASEGNMGAFEEIYKVASGFVYSVALRITNNPDDAQEVTQDVFIIIYKSLKKFRFRSSFKTWLYRVTVNTAINSYKKISKEMNRRDNYDIAVERQCASRTTEVALERKDNERVVASLLNILNPEQRVCIILREIEGLSYKEISEVLKININTVRSRLKRAREALLAYGKRGVVKNEL